MSKISSCFALKMLKVVSSATKYAKVAFEYLSNEKARYQI